jgi:hypothetical protein
MAEREKIMEGHRLQAIRSKRWSTGLLVFSEVFFLAAIMFGNVLGIARWSASGPVIRIAQKLEARAVETARKTKPDTELWKADFAWCRISCGLYPSPMPVSRIVRIGFEPRYLAVEIWSTEKLMRQRENQKAFPRNLSR